MPPPQPSHLQSSLRARGWVFYGITTADRPEREKRLRSEFARLELEVQIHKAGRPSEANGFRNVGTWGCFRSHLACLEQARADGAEVAVMAEDDVVMVRAFTALAPSIAGQLADRPWSMAYLGYLRAPSPAVEQDLELISPNLARLDGWEVMGTQLYAVHARALDDLIENFRKRLQPGGHRIGADGVLNEFRRDQGLETLVCVPNLAHQAPSNSGISPGSGRLDRIRSSILAHPVAQPAVEAVKRNGWDLISAVPPNVHVRAWRLRLRLRRRAAAA